MDVRKPENPETEVRSGKLGFYLTVLTGLLSLITGWINLSKSTRIMALSRHVPDFVQQAVSFTGALTGVLVLALAWGLKNRYRLSLRAAFLILPVTLLQAVIQAGYLSLPLITVSIFALLELVRSRSAFRRKMTLDSIQMLGGIFVLVVLFYGITGAYMLRRHFTHIDGIDDAFYFVVITASTVGYGDITPESGIARSFTVSLVILGTAAFGFSIAAILQPVIEKKLKDALGKMTSKELDLLENHLIILGHSDLTETILQEVGDEDFILVTRDNQVAERLREKGVLVLNQDLTDEDTLRRCKIGDARAVLVASSDDSDNSLAVLTANQLEPDVKVVAAVSNRENVGKLRKAGADIVLSPASIAGKLLVESALTDHTPDQISEALEKMQEMSEKEDQDG
ncbi:MAG: NAD-binding protein [Halobacteria archaeon]